ncbi:MAG: sigma 54-interacting transcriptional regulator [Deltaproteobacteria bacterium]|nr:sigma 54-interacting transcriptional regulator [Deltaproteobacteria bacterium]
MSEAAAHTSRRHVRVKCLLRVAGRELIGFSTNLSSASLHVRVDKDELEDVIIEPGAVIDARFYLPQQVEPIRVTTHAGWVEPDERAGAGDGAVGIGLQIQGASPQVTERLDAFVAGFRYSVMIVDADDAGARSLAQALNNEYRVIECPFGADVLSILGYEEIAVLITGQRLRDMSGLELISRIGESLPRTHLVSILLSDDADAGSLLSSAKIDKLFCYLKKPLVLADFRQILGRAVDAYAMAAENERLAREIERTNRQLMRENRYLRQRVSGVNDFAGIVGNSPKLREALAALGRIRKTEATVHVHGETGTGKELVARALHEGGPRAKGPFVAQNCGGMTESLLQSTLFGHKKGAFTGADRDQPGVFREATGGTLFLDEVADMSPALQAALLRVLQEREIVPVGGRRAEKVDARVISATHKDLRAEVETGRFREDLYFRLVVISVRLPPLRERIGDIPLLAMHLLDALCTRYGNEVPGFTSDAMAALGRYPWPGNVRELENEISRLVILAEPGQKILRSALAPHIAGPLESNPASAALEPLDRILAQGIGLDQALEEYERGILVDALGRFESNRSSAAKALGMPRQTLVSKLKKFRIET